MKAGEVNLEGLPGYDAGHLLMSSWEYMLESARTAVRSDSFSYRNFNVGAAVFALNPETQSSGILTAGNVKTSRHTTKVCAEQKVLQQAKKAGFTAAAGLLVVGETDKDKIQGVTGFATPTLHCCQECRHFFHDHPLMRGDTPIVTAGVDKPIFEVHTADELADLYAREDREALEEHPTIRSFDGWEQHIAMYDYLSLGEQQIPESQRRSASQLIKMAMTATF